MFRRISTQVGNVLPFEIVTLKQNILAQVGTVLYYDTTTGTVTLVPNTSAIQPDFVSEQNITSNTLVAGTPLVVTRVQETDLYQTYNESATPITKSQVGQRLQLAPDGNGILDSTTNGVFQLTATDETLYVPTSFTFGYAYGYFRRNIGN